MSKSSDSTAPGRSGLSYPSIHPSDVSGSRWSSRHSLLGTSNGPVNFLSFKSNNEKPLRLLLLSILLLLYIYQGKCNLCGYKRTVWRLLMTSGMAIWRLLMTCGMAIIIIYLPAVHIQGRVKLYSDIYCKIQYNVMTWQSRLLLIVVYFSTKVSLEIWQRSVQL